MTGVKVCPYCGTTFLPPYPHQIFCCRRCTKKYHKKIGKPHPDNARLPVFSEFTCKECGKHVYIREMSDQRTEFCCARCCERYYKHKRERNCTTNMGMSGGMSLGSLIRRERRSLD